MADSQKFQTLFISIDLPSQIGERIDKVLAEHPLIASRSRAAKLLELGLITHQGLPIKASYKVQAGDSFIVQLPQEKPTELQPYHIPLDILFEDNDLLVVNKPAGLVVHPAPGHTQDTLVNALITHQQGFAMGFGEQRPGIVHRLDKDTSGILVVAKNDFTQNSLVQQFKNRTIHRKYWAIVYGYPKPPSGTLTSYLRRHPQHRKRFASERLIDDQAPKGKIAITHYRVLQELSSGLCLLECQLETGRTHQIRVHLSEKGHPIVGDSLYGSDARLSGLKSPRLRQQIKNWPRIALHACELGFIHPRSETSLYFQRPWPADTLWLLK